MNREGIINKLKEYFDRRNDVAFAYLFGSIAKETKHSESDIDIGIYFTPKNKMLEYESTSFYQGENEIWIDLEEILKHKIDLIVLNRAPSTLFYSVLKEGIKIFSKNDGLLSRLDGVVSDLAEEFAYFINDFVKIKERSRSLSEIDRPRLQRIVDFIEDQISDFKTFAFITQKEYERDRVMKRNLERWAETLSNASIDVAKILIASEKRPIPQTYKTIVKDLAFLKNFDESVASTLASFSDLRNALAHEYLDLRFPILEKFVKQSEPAYVYLINYCKNKLDGG